MSGGRGALSQAWVRNNATPHIARHRRLVDPCTIVVLALLTGGQCWPRKFGETPCATQKNGRRLPFPTRATFVSPLSCLAAFHQRKSPRVGNRRTQVWKRNCICRKRRSLSSTDATMTTLASEAGYYCRSNAGRLPEGVDGEGGWDGMHIACSPWNLISQSVGPGQELEARGSLGVSRAGECARKAKPAEGNQIGRSKPLHEQLELLVDPLLHLQTPWTHPLISFFVLPAQASPEKKIQCAGAADDGFPSAGKDPEFAVAVPQNPAMYSWWGVHEQPRAISTMEN